MRLNRKDKHMWQYTPTNELMHYGVRGMKWGRRKSVGSKGEKITTTKIPFNKYTKTINKDGSRVYEQEHTNPFGAKQTKVTNMTKNQVIVGKAAAAGMIALNGALLVKNLKHFK